MRKTPMPPRKARLKARKGLGRKARLKAGAKGLKRVNRARRSKLWVRCFLSDEYVRFTQERPCACGCGRSPCEVSHDPTRGAGGTYKQSHALFPECHAELHAKGSRTFWQSRGKTREAVSREHHGAWLEYMDSLPTTGDQA